jgi:hypothetical protein
MVVAAVDLLGRVSAPARQPLRVMPLGTGDVEVTLTMSRSTDLDLYVTDPAGVTIYYGNANSASGGRLDLDANAACSSNMDVNAEHVFYAPGRAPAGTYRVRVAHFESCIAGEPVDYRITVRNCGETAVLSGRFTGDGDTRVCTMEPDGGVEWCHDVLRFDVLPCAGAAAP